MSRLSRQLARLLTIVPFVVGGVCGAAPGASVSPFEAIRSLQQLQDQIAEGDAIAQAAHAKAIERTARVFSSARLSTWSDARNARALVLYLFSGGRGATIADAVPESAVASDYRALYRGALAYGLGNDDEARDILMPIDAKMLPSGVGGHLALVQATLCADQDAKKAIALLDLARLLEPGTLIEEAALRKEMSMIGSTGNLDKFGLLARRYLGVFSHSVYADNFRQLVAATAMQISAANSDEAGLSLSRIAGSLSKTDRRRLYLAIARAAVLSGHLKMAAIAAEQARALSDAASPDEARALVYLGAASIVGDRYDAGHKALDSVAPDRLAPRDRALRASAVALAEMIRKPAVDNGQGPTQAARIDLVADGERSLSDADKLLDRASK
jgi:chemotaxis protein MotC